MRLYVTGGTGLVGSNIIKVARERYHTEVIAALYGPPPTSRVDYTLDRLDMRDQEDIRESIQKYRPHAVIHAAALLDQKMINTHRKLAWSVMVGGTRAFAEACREIGARFIFISSDWVFDGIEAQVDEDSAPNPVNFYGVMKMASERELSAMDDLNYGVARLAGVYGLNYAIPSMTRWDQGVGFGDLPNYCVERFETDNDVEIWSDDVNEAAHPTLASDGAEMVIRLAQHQKNGIFHCFGSESIDRIGLAHTTAEVFGANPEAIKAVSRPEEVAEENAGIRIPYRTVASTVKTSQALGRTSYNVKEGLEAFKEEIKDFGELPF